MKVIIAGSRGITNIKDIVQAVEDAGFEITEVISGTARGVDVLGEQYAEQQGLPVIKMPADWDTYGKSAGYRRNADMAMIANALIAIWDGESRGTQHMINLAHKQEIPVHIHIV